MSTLPITKRGAEKLKEELHRLKTVDRPWVINAVAEARAQGASWTLIGAMLGVTRQAALKRYHRAA